MQTATAVNKHGRGILGFLGFSLRSGIFKPIDQEAENRKFVARIFAGNFRPLLCHEQKALNDDFFLWQITQKELHSKISSRSVFKPLSTVSDQLPTDIHWYELVIVDGFTAPYPVTHEGNMFAVKAFVGSVLLSCCSSSKESRAYFFHVKDTFANHTMVYGITRIDVYRRK